MTEAQLEKKREYNRNYMRKRRADPVHGPVLADKKATYRKSDAGKAAAAAYERKWRKANPKKVAETQLRADAKRYGINLEKTYEELLKEQNGKCACCGIDESTQQRRFSVDHVHGTGEVRGLLCTNCNTSIGKLGDDLKGIVNAMNYILRTRK